MIYIIATALIAVIVYKLRKVHKQVSDWEEELETCPRWEWGSSEDWRK